MARCAFAIASRGNSRDDRSPMLEFMIVMVLQVVFGILGSLITSWYSRQREFRADRGGATLAGRDRMIGALRRLAANRELIEPAHPELATLKISGNPGWAALFSTHPPLEVRIAALENSQMP
jgi:heat shock protein HtpX